MNPRWPSDSEPRGPKGNDLLQLTGSEGERESSQAAQRQTRWEGSPIWLIGPRLHLAPKHLASQPYLPSLLGEPRQSEELPRNVCKGECRLGFCFCFKLDNGSMSVTCKRGKQGSCGTGETWARCLVNLFIARPPPSCRAELPWAEADGGEDGQFLVCT